MRKILYLILNLAAVILASTFVFDLVLGFFNSNVSSVKRKTLKTAAIGLFLVFLIPFCTSFFIDEPVLDTAELRIAHHAKHKLYLELNDDYFELLQKDTLNFELNFKYVNSFLQFINKLKREDNFEVHWVKKLSESKRMVEYYESMLENDDTHDLASIFLSIHMMDIKEQDVAIEFIMEVKDKSLPVYSYALGHSHLISKDIEMFKKAEGALIATNSDTISRDEGYNDLAKLYYIYGKKNELKLLIESPGSIASLPLFYNRIVYLRSMDFINYWKSVFNDELKNIVWWSVFPSLLILLLWLFYLRQVDIYESEKWQHILVTLLLSMFTIFLVYPLHDIFGDVIHYYKPVESGRNFIYIMVTIGMVEEFVKILPVLIILKFTNAIDEPFDYILYCSVSAIGFAFIENLGYIQVSSLNSMNARALMASMGHITFSATIGYGMMLARYRPYINKYVVFITFFIFAAAMHGFYDFWLMDKSLKVYSWITVIFLLISVHLWHMYANNTLNITTFYDKSIVVRNDRLKYYLIISLLGILMVSYFLNSLSRGPLFGGIVLQSTWYYYGYFILYLGFSLSRFEIVRGYVAPISIPLQFLVPKIKRYSDYSGQHIVLSNPQRLHFIVDYKDLEKLLPMDARLVERMVVEDCLESYLVKLKYSHTIPGFEKQHVVIMPKSDLNTLNDPKQTLSFLFLIPSMETLNKPSMTRLDFQFVGWVLSGVRRK